MSFYQWSPKNQNADIQVACNHSWIGVKGKPLHLCNNLVFTEIGLMCDDLMDVDRLTMELNFLSHTCL